MSKSFTEISNASKSTALVVDALNLCFRWKHAGRSDFRYEFVKVVESLAQSYKCGTIIITADHGNSTYRKEIHPEYKQNRKEKFAEQTEEEKQKFQEFFSEYEQALIVASEKYPVLRYPGVEADDLAAYIVQNRSKFELNEIWLISSDRDWDLLVTEGVRRWSYVIRKEVNINNWAEHYGVEPEQYISFKCLTGDSGDNIPGVAGIGPKRAASLLQEYNNVFDIYDALPLPGKAKYIQNLNSDPELLMKNLELMDLETFCEEAIGEDNVKELERTLFTHS